MTSLPRRHNAFTGKTVPTPECQIPDVDADLDIMTLVNDCMGLLTTVFPDPATSPSLLVRPSVRFCCAVTLMAGVKLVGHSLGGSVCVRVVPLLLERNYRITGVAVLDVVEGTLGYKIIRRARVRSSR
jgi:protein phosphatase methylesterase 1